MSARNPMVRPELSVLPLMMPHDAGAPDPRHHLVAAEFLQLLGNDPGGAVGVEQDLGMFVQVAPPRGDLGQHLGKTVLHGHGTSPWFCVSAPGIRRSTISAKKLHP